MQDASRLSNRQATAILLAPTQPVSMGDIEWTLVTWSTSNAVWLVSISRQWEQPPCPDQLNLASVGASFPLLLIFFLIITSYL